MKTTTTTRALVPVPVPRPRIPSTSVRGVDGWVDETPRILLRGVDTAHFSFDVEVTDETYLRLMGEQLRARIAQKDRNAAYCSEWLGCRVAPTGVKGYALLLETEAWAIKLHKGNPTRPALFVELRSFAIHTYPGGVLGLAEEVCSFIREVLLEDASNEVRAAVCLGHEKLSRLDWHLDWQGGWHPTLAEQEQRLFIKPGHAKLNAHLEGDRCTGYDVGRRRIVARVYNKTVQAREKGLDWYIELVRQAAGDAYNPSCDVWRLEFELKREGVTGFQLYTPPEASDPDEVIEAELEAEELPNLGTLKKALHWQAHVWRYLTARWLRLVLRDDEDTNRARWPTHPTWLVLQAGFDDVRSPISEAKARLVRAHQHTGYARLLDRMGIGIAATAELLLDSDPASVVPAYLEHVVRVAALAAAKHGRTGSPREEGAAEARRRRRIEAVQRLAEMALGVFAGAAVVKAELPRVGSVADLLCYLVDDLEEVARAKGGIGQILHDKWCRTYKITPPRGLFHTRPLHDAA